MSAMVTTVAQRSVAQRLDTAAFALLLALVAAVQFSIAAAQALLGLAAIAWIARLAIERQAPSAPAFFLPLGAYAAATLVASAFSLDRAASFLDSRQLLLFAVVPMAYDLCRQERAASVLTWIITAGAASAAFGIVQYALLHYDTLGRRPHGTLHYMTYSGALMLVVCAAAARLLFTARDRAWPAVVMPALLAALALTLTRGAWVGAGAAVGLLLVLRDLRLAALLPVAVALFFALAPDPVTSRMRSILDVQDPSNRDRLAMLRSGAAMVADDPLTGVGPDVIPQVYAQYRDASAVNALNPHLHNNALQIAAERGLPALVVWLVFVAMCASGLGRLFRAPGDRSLPAAGLAALTAMLAAGLFEYNFGDSEFLMLFLVMMTLPFAAARAGRAA